jgi:branched-chain amino acid transport system ATP-binding protein
VPCVLELRDVCIHFGGLKVIEKMNLKVDQGELVGLIGPNGAGKTTAFNLISGIYRPTEGEIFFCGESLKDLGPSPICKLGVVRTFQNIRLFPEMTVLGNILVAMHKDCRYGLFSSIFKLPSYLATEKSFFDRAEKLLAIFGLGDVHDDLASSLPYGKQRKLEIVRALAGNPKFILLDEPAAGMNLSEKQELMRLIQKIRDEFKLTILLIEHDMKLVMGICERLVVLDHGVVIAEGKPESVRNNKKVIEAYLGVEEEGA